MKYLRLLLIAVLPFFAACARADLDVPAPAWKLKDVNGQEVSSEQFKDKVVVVDFWATWCGPCRAEIPGYVELQKKYGDKLAIIGMSVDEQGPDVVKKFVADNQVTYTIVMADQSVIEAFAGDQPIEGIPTTFIVDRTGRLRERKVGAEATSAFEQRLQKYLN